MARREEDKLRWRADHSLYPESPAIRKRYLKALDRQMKSSAAWKAEKEARRAARAAEREALDRARENL